MNVMRSFSTGIVAILLFVALALPALVSAQSAEEQALRDTIRAAILSDPRSQGMTESEVEAMVSALTRQAQSVGMTPEDIVWRPTQESAAGQAAAGACGGFLCELNRAFGFDGSDYTIPIWLGACALMLIFLIAGIWEYQHLHKRKMAASQQSQVQ